MNFSDSLAVITRRSNVTVAVVGREPHAGVVGDWKHGEPPVPIPNTEVKPVLPMLLLCGKVGYRRLYGLARGIPGRALFLFWFLAQRSFSAVLPHSCLF